MSDRAADPFTERQTERGGTNGDDADDHQRFEQRRADVENRKTDPERIETDRQRCEQETPTFRKVELGRLTLVFAALFDHVQAEAHERDKAEISRSAANQL